MKDWSSLPLINSSHHIIRNTFNASSVAYIIASMTTTAGALIDGVIIGQFLGLESMAAFGLVSPVIIVFAVLGATIAAGARNRFTLLVGNGDLAGARGIFSLSMILGAGISILLMAVVFIFADPICRFLGAEGSAAGLLEKTRGYLLGLAIGLPAINASRVLYAYMSIDSDRQLTIISSLAMTVVDIVLDVLIAVTGGDTFGMGLATSISHYVSLGVLMTHFRRKDRLIRFSPQDIRWRETGGLIRSGLPTGVGRLSNTARTIILNRMLAAFSAASCIAAFSVHRQADSFLNPFVFGIADTMVILVGILVGEENRPMIRRLTQNCTALISSLVLGISVLFWFAAPLFARFFVKNEPAALEYSIRAARSFTAGLPLYALNRAYIGYLEGRGKVRTAMVLSFFSEGAFQVLMALLLLPMFKADAVWYAFPASQVLLTLTILGVIIYLNRKQKTRPADFWEWLMALPADFDVPEQDRIDRTITSQDEVIALSQAAWKFCDDHGCDEKRKYAISLSVEELATNTVTYGFLPHRRNTIDMRILKKGDDYILRFRDDCEIFDPVKQLQLYDPSIPLHHRACGWRSARRVTFSTPPCLS